MPDSVTRRQFLRTLISPSDTQNILTPTDQFFQQQWRHQPAARNPDYWGLLVDGLTNTPLALSFNDLQQFSQTGVTCTLACAGDLVGTAHWQGVLFQALLAEVQPQPLAQHAGFYTADGYSTSLRLSQLENALLAYTMNGKPLPHEHGGPVRLIVPGRQGYKMPKWLQRIELRDSPLAGPWEQRGWSLDGEAPTLARFVTPQHRTRVQGPVQLAGFAFAGQRQPTSVAISVNGGPWMPVNFHTPGPFVWSQWSINWTAPHPGEHRLTVRAIDDLQTSGQSHTITVYVE